MTTRNSDPNVAQRIEAVFNGLGGPLSVERQPVIGDMAYLYVRCARFRSLLDDLLSKEPTPDLRASLQKELYAVLAEIENINATTADLKDGLEKALEEIPNAKGQ